MSNRYFSNFKKIIFATIVGFQVSSLAFTASAQNFRRAPYGFVQAGAGISSVMHQNNEISPAFNIGIGSKLTKEIGVRISATGFEQKIGFSNDSYKGKYKYINTGIDVMASLNGILDAAPGPVEFNLLAGLGYAFGWDYDKIRDNVSIAKCPEISNSLGKNFNGVNFRAGLGIDFNIGQNWAIGAEGTFIFMGDDFDFKVSKHNSDVMFNTQLVGKFKF